MIQGGRKPKNCLLLQMGRVAHGSLIDVILGGLDVWGGWGYGWWRFDVQVSRPVA